MRSIQKINSTVRAYLTVYDAADAPVTGLVSGDFDKLLAFNGANSAVPVTVTEIGGGRYVATFTPNLSGAWYLLIRQPANNPRGWEEEFDVTVDGPYVINDIFDKEDGVETGYTLRQTLRAMSAMLCGKASGGPAGSIFRNMGDTVNRVTTVADANGNRTTMTLNV